MRKASTSCKGFDGFKVLYLWNAVLDNVIGGLFTMRKRYSCSKQLFGAFEVDAALDNAIGGHFEVGDEIFMQCAIIW